MPRRPRPRQGDIEDAPYEPDTDNTDNDLDAPVTVNKARAPRGGRGHGDVDMTNAHFLHPDLELWDDTLLTAHIAMKPCRHCGSLLFHGESKSMCCSKGTKIVEQAHMDWWDRPSNHRDRLLKVFDLPKMQRRCRAYNNLFTFTAMSHNMTTPGGAGVSMLSLGGRTQHYQKSVEELNALQWHLYDPVERLAAAENQQLDGNIVRSVARVMEQVNVHARLLVSERDRALQTGQPLSQLHVTLLHEPRSTDVAALTHPGRSVGIGNPRDVVINWKAMPRHIRGQLKRLRGRCKGISASSSSR